SSSNNIFDKFFSTVVNNLFTSNTFSSFTFGIARHTPHNVLFFSILTIKSGSIALTSLHVLQSLCVSGLYFGLFFFSSVNIALHGGQFVKFLAPISSNTSPHLLHFFWKFESTTSTIF